VRAEISAEFVDRLAQTVGWAGRPRAGGSGTKDEDGPADDGGANKTIMHSYGLCPRQVPRTWETALTSENDDLVIVEGCWPLPLRGQ
jgi:hypothetical protein